MAHHNTDMDTAANNNLAVIGKAPSDMERAKIKGPVLTPLAKYYRRCCQEFGVAPNASLSVLFQHPSVHVLEANSREFSLRDMLVLGEVLKKDNRIDTLCLASCHMDSNCIYVLRDVMAVNKTIKRIDLSYNLITRYGAAALGDVLGETKTLTHLKLRGNYLDAQAAYGLADGLAANRSLRLLDVSNNAISVAGINCLSKALSARKVSDEEKESFIFLMNGNYWAEELVNSITHGVGLVLSIVFGALLLGHAHQSEAHPVAYYWSCVIYILSLIALYACSTLAHSFHRMMITGRVFEILDHSCISLLIAGSYTPFCLVTLGHTWHGTALCVTMWSMAAVAVCLSLMGPHYRAYELSLFLAMGWAAVLPLKPIVSCTESAGLAWLVIGGLWYTVGVYFFIRGRTLPIMHAIWHCFVLAGSICHYVAIYFYVQPCSWVQDLAPSPPIG